MKFLTSFLKAATSDLQFDLKSRCRLRMQREVNPWTLDFTCFSSCMLLFSLSFFFVPFRSPLFRINYSRRHTDQTYFIQTCSTRDISFSRFAYQNASKITRHNYLYRLNNSTGREKNLAEKRFVRKHVRQCGRSYALAPLKFLPCTLT